jgi:hypothetical protein
LLCAAWGKTKGGKKRKTKGENREKNRGKIGNIREKKSQR